jgi:hypothetical protein
MRGNKCLPPSLSPATGIPTDVGVVDTLIGLPPVERRSCYESFKVVLHDEGSKRLAHPASTME